MRGEKQEASRLRRKALRPAVAIDDDQAVAATLHHRDVQVRARSQRVGDELLQALEKPSVLRREGRVLAGAKQHQQSERLVALANDHAQTIVRTERTIEQI